MCKLFIRIQQVNNEGPGNESVIEVAILHRQLLKPINDLMLKTL